EGAITITASLGDITQSEGHVVQGDAGQITLTSMGAMAFDGDITSTSGTITLEAAVIRQGGDLSTGQAGQVVLTSQVGDVVMAGDTSTSTMHGDIQVNAAGHMQLAQLVALDGDMFFNSAQTITDSLANMQQMERANLTTTGHVTFTSGGQIGAVSEDLDLDVGSLQATIQGAGDLNVQAHNGLHVTGTGVLISGVGDVNIEVVSGDLSSDAQIRVSGSDIALKANQGSITLDGALWSPHGEVAVTAAQDITQSERGDVWTAQQGTVQFHAVNGGIHMHSGALTATENGQILYQAHGDIQLAQLHSQMGNLVLESGASILDNQQGEQANVTTQGALQISAVDDIGTTADDLDSTVHTMDGIHSQKGEINLHQSETMTVSDKGVDVAQGAGQVSLTVESGGLLLFGDIEATSGDVAVDADAINQHADITSQTGSVAITTDVGNMMMAEGTHVRAGEQGNVQISVEGDFGVTQVSAGQTITVQAGNNGHGGIADHSLLEGANFSSTLLNLESSGGLGVEGRSYFLGAGDLDTQVDTLNALNREHGSILIQEEDALTVGDKGIWMSGTSKQTLVVTSKYGDITLQEIQRSNTTQLPDDRDGIVGKLGSGAIFVFSNFGEYEDLSFEALAQLAQLGNLNLGDDQPLDRSADQRGGFNGPGQGPMQRGLFGEGGGGPEQLGADMDQRSQQMFAQQPRQAQGEQGEQGEGQEQNNQPNHLLGTQTGAGQQAAEQANRWVSELFKQIQNQTNPPSNPGDTDFGTQDNRTGNRGVPSFSGNSGGQDGAENNAPSSNNGLDRNQENQNNAPVSQGLEGETDQGADQDGAQQQSSQQGDVGEGGRRQEGAAIPQEGAEDMDAQRDQQVEGGEGQAAQQRSPSNGNSGEVASGASA
ncbi:hypothetical protein, partial [Magnetococcus sp. PR-3]|uniref:hypothetical protein n=1 Tax=Magnetococcus sp. PR-3 TaxID=3120355 RepID=UPI002FCE4ECF